MTLATSPDFYATTYRDIYPNLIFLCLGVAR